MIFTYEKSRDTYKSADVRLREVFGDAVIGECDAAYLNACHDDSPVVGICGLERRIPVCVDVINNPEISGLLCALDGDVLLLADNETGSAEILTYGEEILLRELPPAAEA